MEKVKDLKYYSNIEGYTSIIVNFILAGLKYWAGVASGSIALVADAWHSLTDSFSSIIVIISGKISSKPADKKHPFGHGRFEFIAAFLIAVLLFIVAYSFIREAVQNMSVHEGATYGPFAVIILVISVLAKEALAQLAFRVGRRSGSLALKADGWHHRTDSISSVIILVGIVFGRKLWWIDSVLGIIVALFIAWTAYRIMEAAISSFLGESPEGELMSDIKKVCEEYAGKDSDAHEFKIHNYVIHKELIFHLRLDGNMNINESHKLISKIEELIEQKHGINTTIHVEPLNKK